MDKRLNLILQQLDTLPTLPGVALKVLEVTGNSATSVRDVVAVIGNDPALATRILQIVNRADFGATGGEKIASIERAVAMLGFDAIRHAVLAVSVFQTFQGTAASPASAFSRDDFWMHCVGVACAAELLATETKKSDPASKIDPGEAFVCGLLHDIGKVALDATLPKSFARVIEAAELLRGNIADLERQIVGLDHMVVGKRLAEKWQLPATIRDAIWLHGQTPEALPATVTNARLVNLITLADAIVREQHIGYSGNFLQPVSQQALASLLGLSAKQIEIVHVRLVAQIEPRAKSLGLGQASSSELYQQALEQANKELGRVTDQLSSKNRRLAIRSKFFEALSEFHSELRPDAPTQTVLAAIGQTAVSVLGATSAAIFSLPPKAAFAETVLVDGHGEVFENTLVDVELGAPNSSSGAAGAAGAGFKSEIRNQKSEVQTGHSQVPPGHRERGDEAQLSGDVESADAVIRKPGDGPIQSAGNELEWMLAAVSPRLGCSHRFWICLEADGRCIGGVVWGAMPGEAERLGTQTQELAALASGWSLALRTAQIRDEARTLAEQLAEANRQLQTAQTEISRKRTIVTVGEMAAGAAHEMNNPLMVISGRSQLLASQLSDPKQKAAAMAVHENSMRLSAIITELMDFAKPEPAKVEESDISELVHRILHEAKAANDSVDSLRVETTVTDVPPVMVDVKQVGQAIAEILANAIDATAADEATGRPAGHIEIHAALNPHAWNVVLTIADNGCGMDDATLKRAFDPFFSHKPAGRQRGMGLSKAQRWIESSGGSVRLESHLGRGTRAVIVLPAAKKDGAANATQVAPARRLKA